jgi:hypothetical protein
LLETDQEIPGGLSVSTGDPRRTLRSQQEIPGGLLGLNRLRVVRDIDRSTKADI